MKNNKGFTLIELVIATTIILIVSLGFFGWASTIIQTNLSIERNNTAYAMLMDVAERLQRMSDNSLILHNTTRKCVGYDGAGNIGECRAAGVINCTTGTVTTNVLASGQTGMTIYTNPIQSNNTPYLYDNNACVNTTWLTCRTSIPPPNINTGSNANIDHPNSTTGTPNYDSINPIRSYKNTTYYAVWSVAYMPCNAGTNTDRRKIFVTVYWIDPEPSDTDLIALPGRIAAGTATVKSVSIVVDKAIGTES